MKPSPTQLYVLQHYALHPRKMNPWNWRTTDACIRRGWLTDSPTRITQAGKKVLDEWVHDGPYAVRRRRHASEGEANG